MEIFSVKKLLYPALGVVSLFLVIEYFLPLFLPFLLGGFVAFAAEPEIGFLEKRLGFSRLIAALLGITLAFFFLSGILLGVLSLLLRQLRYLGNALPEILRTTAQGLSLLQSWLLELTGNLPQEPGKLVSDWIVTLFGNGSALLNKGGSMLLGYASGLLGRLPGSALSLGTGILTAYMVSIKLPRIQKNPLWQHPTVVSLLKRLSDMKQILLSYGRAQLSLMGVIFLLLLGGLLLLRIPFAPLWAVLIAIVDAIPILGTGTILIPWSLICMLQGNHFQSIGLLLLFVLTTLGRTVLEPRFLGKELGLDPLVTLLCLYIGFRLWGLWGLILVPLFAVVILRSFPRFS